MQTLKYFLIIKKNVVVFMYKYGNMFKTFYYVY